MKGSKEMKASNLYVIAEKDFKDWNKVSEGTLKNNEQYIVCELFYDGLYDCGSNIRKATGEEIINKVKAGTEFLNLEITENGTVQFCEVDKDGRFSKEIIDTLKAVAEKYENTPFNELEMSTITEEDMKEYFTEKVTRLKDFEIQRMYGISSPYRDKSRPYNKERAQIMLYAEISRFALLTDYTVNEIFRIPDKDGHTRYRVFFDNYGEFAYDGYYSTVETLEEAFNLIFEYLRIYPYCNSLL